MEAILLIDFGSTRTKVTAVDVHKNALLGTASSYTTVETDINDGLTSALESLQQATGPLTFAHRFACSSAAGGLRMIASGLVPELTAEAARITCLGAGAKIIRLFSFELTDEDIEEIDLSTPDIFLLTGGVDGGNSKTILHNAAMLARCKATFPILIAGNRSATAECAAILAPREVYRCPNIMPKVNQLNTSPVQDKIRELFLSHIIQAKGLTRAKELVSGIMMPTPAAMLEAMKLLASGTKTQPGIGELMAIDLGGATTDIYSIATGSPDNDSTILKGLPEPYEKRTVEGDIGMRYSATGVLQAVGEAQLAALSGLTEAHIQSLVQHVSDNPDMLPTTETQHALDYAIAAGAVSSATTRHAGTLEEAYTPMGQVYVQTGKNLTHVRTIIATGGALVHSSRTDEILAHALYSPEHPLSLRPKKASICIDRKYILAAMGLLASYNPECALHIMKKELECHGINE